MNHIFSIHRTRHVFSVDYTKSILKSESVNTLPKSLFHIPVDSSPASRVADVALFSASDRWCTPQIFTKTKTGLYDNKT